MTFATNPCHAMPLPRNANGNILKQDLRIELAARKG